MRIFSILALFCLVMSLHNASCMQVHRTSSDALSITASDNSFFFTRAMLESHLVNYDAAVREMVEKDFAVVRSVCTSQTSCGAGDDKPFYLATAGAPGARKSTILEKFLAAHPEFSHGWYLDPDQRALKFMAHTYHAQSLNSKKCAENADYQMVQMNAYNTWRPASNYITIKLLEEAFLQHSSVIHGTTSTGGHIPTFFKKLKEAGYTITLLLCSCEDEVRKQAISYRNEVQRFYQSSPEDAISKGLFFPQKMSHYMNYADTLYLFWSDELFTSEHLAAVLQNGKMSILDSDAYDRYTKKYEKDRQQLAQQGINLASWQELLDLYKDRF